MPEDEDEDEADYEDEEMYSEHAHNLRATVELELAREADISSARRAGEV